MFRRALYFCADWLRAFVSALGALCPPRWSLAIIALGVLMVLSSSLYYATQHTVFLEINDLRFAHRTHARTASQVLREAGVSPEAEDRLQMPTEEALLHGEPIRLTIARTATVVHDGTVTQFRTQAADLAGLVQDGRLVVFPHDHIEVMGQDASLDVPLPAPKSLPRSGVLAWLDEIRRPIRVTIRRAVPLRVQDGPADTTLYTTARTVGQALYECGLILYVGDRVSPDPEAMLAPGQSIIIERAKPVILSADGIKRTLRTRTKKVSELLAAEGVTMGPKDYALPDPRTTIARDLEVSVVRVFDEYYSEEVPIAYRTRWEPDPAMEIDQSQVTRWGREGARRQRIRIHYENGKELYRTEEEEWVAREPLDRIINYGTKIVLRTLETPTGALTYWRKLRMLATSYNAPTAGVSRSSPWYGRTRLGWQAAKGIVAVDPGVISLGQSVYVLGYGVAVAADTGGAIKGRRIDLCYDEDNLEFWYRWVDVYLLTPVPPEDKIEWLVPNTPRQRE